MLAAREPEGKVAVGLGGEEGEEMGRSWSALFPDAQVHTFCILPHSSRHLPRASLLQTWLRTQGL